MEISALSPSPSLSLSCPPGFPSPHSPFSDQSHLQFYGPVLHRKGPGSFFVSQSKRGPQSLAAARLKHLLVAPLFVAGACPPAVSTEVADEQDLVVELADIKALLKQKQLKEKRKELKTQMKAMKKSLKLQKQKTAKSKGCSSSSSSESESESSVCERETADIKLLRQEQVALTESGSPDLVRASVHEIDITRNRLNAVLPVRSSVDFSCVSAKSSEVAGKIEVCVGGKCKKAGSQLLLSSLRSQIPSNSAVEAVPCKCMGKCEMSINVKIQKEETNPLYHSHVGTEDASLLLSHFKLRPPSHQFSITAPLCPWPHISQPIPELSPMKC